MIITNNRIGSKKPSGLILPPMGGGCCPAGVLDLDIYTTSEADPSEDPLSPVYAPVALITSPFLHILDSSKASDDSSSNDSFMSHSSLDSHKVVVARWRGKVASRPSSPSSTHALPCTDITSPAPCRVVLALPGVHRRPAVLVLPGKRVHPFLARIPANHRRSISSSSASPRKRHRASPYSSSSDSPSSATTVRGLGELRQICSSRYYDRMDFRRLETFAMRRLGYRP
ncbi:hypothetical protein Tco_1001295 [Tanacetum coccineum]